jgi:putative phosphoesterase
MRIGVISDTHGDHNAIRQVIKGVTNVDMWLHAGDCSQDAEYLASLVAVPVIASRGNCDGQTKARIDEFVEVAGQRIWLTHGHRYGVKQNTRDLVRWGKHHGVDIVIYGHTHVPDNHLCEGMLLFNPGSAAYPHSGFATCGILDIDDEGQVVGSIAHVNG